MSIDKRLLQCGSKQIEVFSCRGDLLSPSITNIIKQVRLSYKLHWGGVDENDSLLWNRVTDESEKCTHFIAKVYDSQHGLTKIVSLTKRRIVLSDSHLPGDIDWWRVGNHLHSITLASALTNKLRIKEMAVCTRFAAYTPYHLQKIIASPDNDLSISDDTLIGLATILQQALRINEWSIWTFSPILQKKLFSIQHKKHEAILAFQNTLDALDMAQTHQLILVNNASTRYLRTTYPGYWNENESLRSFLQLLYKEKIIEESELPLMLLSSPGSSSSSHEVQQLLGQIHHYELKHFSPLLKGKVVLKSGITKKTLQKRLLSEVQYGPTSFLLLGSQGVENANQVLSLAASKYQ